MEKERWKLKSLYGKPLWPPDAKRWLIRKDPDSGKDRRQEEKGATEDKCLGGITDMSAKWAKKEGERHRDFHHACSETTHHYFRHSTGHTDQPWYPVGWDYPKVWIIDCWLPFWRLSTLQRKRRRRERGRKMLNWESGFIRMALVWAFG